MSLLRLPPEMVKKILKKMTYEELSSIRQTNKTLKRHCERLLNDGFFEFGHKITTTNSRLKRKLPRKESSRRSHPLNRCSEVMTSMETRYTLLSMTYRKHIDAGHCCFIPGKVLDLGFAIITRIGCLANKNDVVIELDVMDTLKDIRDYSSMAMEHFDDAIAPRFPNHFPFTAMSFSKFNPSLILDRPSPSSSSGITLGTGQPFSVEAQRYIEEDLEEMKLRQDNQDRKIEALSEQIDDQNKIIRQLVGIVKEVGKAMKDVNPELDGRLAALTDCSFNDDQCVSDDIEQMPPAKRMKQESADDPQKHRYRHRNNQASQPQSSRISARDNRKRK